MEPAPLVLLLGLLWGCSGRPTNKLVVMPQQPVVRYGGSTQLNCSLDCAGGTVQWKGLDTNLGSITSFPTHSILHVSSAVVAMEGTKVCQGTWYRGDQALDGVDFNIVETEEELSDIVSTLPVAGKDVVEGVEFRCEVTLSIGQETFTRVASLGICWRGQSLFAITHPSGVSADTVGTGPAIAAGTTFSLLGLILTGVMSHRLWKRFRSQYELS